MNKGNVAQTQDAGNLQPANPLENHREIHPKRKVGAEIVFSAWLPKGCFYGPRPGRNFPVRSHDDFGVLQ